MQGNTGKQHSTPSDDLKSSDEVEDNMGVSSTSPVSASLATVSRGAFITTSRPSEMVLRPPRPLSLFSAWRAAVAFDG